MSNEKMRKITFWGRFEARFGFSAKNRSHRTKNQPCWSSWCQVFGISVIGARWWSSWDSTSLMVGLGGTSIWSVSNTSVSVLSVFIPVFEPLGPDFVLRRFGMGKNNGRHQKQKNTIRAKFRISCKQRHFLQI